MGSLQQIALIQLDQEIKLKNEHLKQLENLKYIHDQEKERLVNATNEKPSVDEKDRASIFNLTSASTPIFAISVKHTLHNGLRHDFYCNCMICKKCWFCNAILKNKSGCLTHYGLSHKELKPYWKTD